MGASSNQDPSKSDTVIITVTAGTPVSITSFTATPASISPGQVASLTPVFTNATSASINNGVGTVTSGVAYNVTPAATTTYTLTANGTGGPVTSTVTVTVITGTPVSITSFTVAPTTITTLGTVVLMSPVFANATSASINNGVGSVTSGVVYTAIPTSTTTYTLTANGIGGPVTRSVTVTVNNGYSISGMISGAVSQGVTINLSGAATASAISDANGRYIFSGLASGSYTITPSLAGYNFSPASSAVSVNADTTQNFAAATSGGGVPSISLTIYQNVLAAIAYVDSNHGIYSTIVPNQLQAYGGSPLSGYTWTVTTGTSLPFLGLQIDPLTGLVHGTLPTGISPGIYYLNVTVSDGSTTYSSQAHVTVFSCDSWTVGSPNPSSCYANAPINAGNNLSIDINASVAFHPIRAGMPFGFSLYVAGGKPPYKNWAVTNGSLPPGLTIDQSRGVLRGTPFSTASGHSYTFSVTVSDSTNAVYPGPSDSPPTYTISIQ